MNIEGCKVLHDLIKFDTIKVSFEDTNIYTVVHYTLYSKFFIMIFQIILKIIDELYFNLNLCIFIILARFLRNLSFSSPQNNIHFVRLPFAVF